MPEAKTIRRQINRLTACYVVAVLVALVASLLLPCCVSNTVQSGREGDALSGAEGTSEIDALSVEEDIDLDRDDKRQEEEEEQNGSEYHPTE